MRDVNIIVSDADKYGIVLKFVAIAFLQATRYYSAKNCGLSFTLKIKSNFRLKLFIFIKTLYYFFLKFLEWNSSWINHWNLDNLDYLDCRKNWKVHSKNLSLIFSLSRWRHSLNKCKNWEKLTYYCQNRGQD